MKIQFSFHPIHTNNITMLHTSCNCFFFLFFCYIWPCRHACTHKNYYCSLTQDSIINDYYNLHVKTKTKNHKFYLYLNVITESLKNPLAKKYTHMDKGCTQFYLYDMAFRSYKIYIYTACRGEIIVIHYNKTEHAGFTL